MRVRLTMLGVGALGVFVFIAAHVLISQVFGHKGPAQQQASSLRVQSAWAEDVQAVIAKYRDELLRIPGVYHVFDNGGRIQVAVFVHTDDLSLKPSELPAPLRTVPSVLEGIPVEVLLPPVYVLPPPAGFVILRPFRPDATTEQCPTGAIPTWLLDHFECYALAATCPDGFSEYKNFDWRYCLNPSVSSYIPNTVSPPLAGIPWAQVEAILARHQMELMQLPGVTSSGLNNDGIVIETDTPNVVPPSIEGVPVTVRPPMGAPYHFIGR